MTKENDVARDLMARVLRNDTQAFAAMYDRYSRLIFTIIVNIVRSKTEAEEILQEVFLTFWNKKNSYDLTKASPLTWLSTMARNKAIDKIRSADFKGTQKTTPTEDGVKTLELLSSGPNPLEGVILEEQQSLVQTALKALPQDQQLILRIAYFEGLTQAEIADRYSIPLGTVKTRMRLALKKLYDLLKEAA